MTSKIAAVANLAFHVFHQHSIRPDQISRHQNNNPTHPDDDLTSSSLHYSDSFRKLLAYLRTITPVDVGFDSRWVTYSEQCTAPVAYVHITENERFSMGMFVLRPGSRIPLHDHPGMYGMLRMIYGAVRCRTFTTQNPPSDPNSFTHNRSRWHQLSTDVLPVHPCQNTILTVDSDVQYLTPTMANIHEIHPVDGPAVFLDILAPPYDHDLGTRECHFYKEVVLPPNNNNTNQVTISVDRPVSDLATSRGDYDRTLLLDDSVPVVYLIETNQPKDYWCESAEYVGPGVI